MCLSVNGNITTGEKRIMNEIGNFNSATGLQRSLAADVDCPLRSMRITLIYF
jgi:hypothetical protein